MKKYGLKNFRYGIIKNCETKAELDAWEKFFIVIFHCKSPYGYNCTDGGEGTIDYTHTTEQRAKAAKSRLGNKNHFGKHHTDETRAKISIAKKGREGKSPYAETRVRIAVAQTGKKETPRHSLPKFIVGNF